jgi:hypothetical protein
LGRDIFGAVGRILAVKGRQQDLHNGEEAILGGALRKFNDFYREGEIWRWSSEIWQSSSSTCEAVKDLIV